MAKKGVMPKNINQIAGWNKGLKGWRKGYKCSKETKEKISKSNLGKKISDESKKKMSEIRKRLFLENKITHPMLGKKHSIESKKKMSLAKKGVPYSKERREKRRILFMGKGNPFYGKKHSKETKEKISLANKGNKANLGRKYPKEKYPNYGLRKVRAKQILPKKDTSIEIKIQNFLKQLNIEFFTHQYIKIEHGYQCDILIPSMNLVIECDGDYWHKYPIGNDLDHVRTKELLEKGFKVLRLWEHEIKDMQLNDFEEKLER